MQTKSFRCWQHARKARLQLLQAAHTVDININLSHSASICLLLPKRVQHTMYTRTKVATHVHMAARLAAHFRAG